VTLEAQDLERTAKVNTYIADTQQFSDELQNYMAALGSVVGWARGAVSQVDACGAKYG